MHSARSGSLKPRTANLAALYAVWGMLSPRVALNPFTLLTLMIAQVVDLEPGEFIHTFGDVHIYLNHLEQVKTQLGREPYPLPEMRLNPERRDLFDFRYEDFELLNYRCHPAIRAPIAV